MSVNLNPFSQFHSIQEFKYILQSTNPQTLDLIIWSLVDKQFFKACGEMYPMIHSEAFALKFDDVFEKIKDDPPDGSKAMIEFVRKTIINDLILSSKKR